MIHVYITGDGLLFWTERDALDHVEEARNLYNEFISCECLTQDGIAETWEERNAIISEL